MRLTRSKELKQLLLLSQEQTQGFKHRLPRTPFLPSYAALPVLPQNPPDWKRFLREKISHTFSCHVDIKIVTFICLEEFCMCQLYACSACAYKLCALLLLLLLFYVVLSVN